MTSPARKRSPASRAAKSISTVAARDGFSDLINRAAYGKERVVLTRRGKPLVALVPIEDAATLEALEDAHDLVALRKAIAEWEKDGRRTVSLQAVARRHGVKL